MPFYTPLRYPGGKRRLAPAIARLFRENDLTEVEYVEPYAGGASLALTLLLEKQASNIHLNDLSRPIYSFWYAVLHRTQELCERIEQSPITMEEWARQREVYQFSPSADLFDLGFATLFLNRTNRSGILSGGVIGGKGQAEGWRLDARFNRQELVRRIKNISQHRDRIRLHNLDGVEFTTSVLPTLSPNAFVFYDPPYIKKGKGLYLNEYTWERHLDLSEHVIQLHNPWVVTYDYEAAVDGGLYRSHQRLAYQLQYTTQARYRGKEVMFISRGLRLPREWKSTLPFNMASDRSDYPFYGMVE